MNPEVKALWLAALEDGSHKKNPGGSLRDGDLFSGLGVLADLYIQSHDDLQWTGNRIENHHGSLLPQITAWAELPGLLIPPGTKGADKPAPLTWVVMDLDAVDKDWTALRKYILEKL